jgi:tRNA dimethylallyltransferase
MDNQMDLDVAVGNIKQHTRNFAKRQLTYLRHQLEPIWIKGGEKAFATIESML